MPGINLNDVKDIPMPAWRVNPNPPIILDDDLYKELVREALKNMVQTRKLSRLMDIGDEQCFRFEKFNFSRIKILKSISPSRAPCLGSTCTQAV